MKPVFERYLSDLEAAMSRLQPEQRADALREIEAHFADATAAGAPADEVIARLGPPRLLAAAIAAETLDRRSASAPVKAWRVIAGSLFFTGTGFTSLILIPLLAATAIGFGLAAVVSPVAGVMRTFGADWIQINIGPGQSLPIGWSIPFTLLLGVVCGAIALGAYKLLQLYLKIVVRGYRAVISRGPLSVSPTG